MSSDTRQPRLSIGVMTIATNIYIEYWAEMIQSADKYPSEQFEITFHVFTEDLHRAQKVAQKLKNVNVQVHLTPAYVWPEATLLRYSIFTEFADRMNQDILMHLDADMLFVSSPWKVFQKSLENFSICLIEHPGFWRPSGASKIRFYKKNTKFVFRDLYRRFVYGALGSWEKNVKSTAFVPRQLRQKYFCGGIWFGKRNAIQALMEDLAQKVSEDSSNGVMAKWHDESHLNKWSSQNQHEVLGPNFCFDTTYPQLIDLQPLILAIRKDELTR